VKALTHPLLDSCGVLHGFGVRGARPPAGLLRPRQVHGVAVVTGTECEAVPPPEADAVVSNRSGRPIGIVTADCVPILLASRDGAAVAAVHAGWRGLAAGIVAAGVARIAELAGSASLRAVVGPYIGKCCYEVEAPVLDALAALFGDDASRHAVATRSGHARIDLGRLACVELVASGLAADAIAAIPDACTRCDSARFHSYRRDGGAAGRLIHHIAARG